MRRLLLLAICPAALVAQDGAAIYKARCAGCHDHPVGRMPEIGALRTMTSVAIRNALEIGVMKAQGATMSVNERSSVAEYLAHPGEASHEPVANPCGAGTALAQHAPVWASWGADAENTRSQNAEQGGLRAGDVPRLRLKWAFNLGKGVTPRAQPAVAFGMIFVGAERRLYALDARSGCVVWEFEAEAPLRTGVTIDTGAQMVFFGAQSTAYALRAGTGKLEWKQKVDDHPAAILTGTPAVYAGVLYVPVSSFEEAAAASPQYACCTFRGSVVALKAASGERLWKTYTIDKDAGAGEHGPSGAAVWSTPTVDRKLGVLYVSTGDNYSPPSTATSDAVLAIDAKTGKLLWSRQITSGDIYNIGCDAG
jgi:polyvinyl alcohol dehydrogenase (cytochrome)